MGFTVNMFIDDYKCPNKINIDFNLISAATIIFCEYLTLNISREAMIYIPCKY